MSMLHNILWSLAAHHGDAADPDLMEWVKSRLDHLLNLGPWLVVILIGLVIVAIPVTVAGAYLLQQRRSSKGV